MPFGAPIFWVSSLSYTIAADSFQVHCAIIWGKCDVIVVTIRTFSRKETKQMAVPDPSSCVFYHFTRKFEDSERQYTWDNWSLQICAALSE